MKATFPTLPDGSTWVVMLDADGEPQRAALVIPSGALRDGRNLAQLRQRHTHLAAQRAAGAVRTEAR